MQKVLLLIDGLNVIRRVYEANPAPDSADKADGAAKSSVSSIRRALREVEATHALCVFDYGGPTFRHAIYPGYKATRKPMPTDLRDRLPEIQQNLAASLGLRSHDLPGVEAEDVIASIIRKIRENTPSVEVVILSTDKDLYPLIGPGVRSRDNFQSEYRDAEWVKQKFHVYPQQLTECLALTGDSVDGVPGVPGVAYKTAAGLLAEFGSLDALLSRAGEVKGKKGENLRLSLDAVRTARKLVTLKDDLILGMYLKDLALPVRA